MDIRRIGILGAQCGGTHAMYYAAMGARLDIGHETMGPDGISCGLWVWRHELAGTATRRTRSCFVDGFETVVHLVRCPLLSSQSLAHFRSSHNHEPWAHEDPTWRAMRYWTKTHERIEAMKPQATIVVGGEDMQERWDAVTKSMGLRRSEIPHTNSKTQPSQAKNRRAPITWDEWREADPEYADRGRALCERVGLV